MIKVVATSGETGFMMHGSSDKETECCWKEGEGAYKDAR